MTFGRGMEYPVDLEINDEFAFAEELAIDGGENLFVTGKAGTGKSTLLKYLAERSGRITAVLAPTGTAALNVGGQTIHSFFRFPLGALQKSDIKRLYGVKAISNVELIIIDEVSMVRADLMDAIDRSLRIHQNRPDKPFGGVQVVAFGDMHQLPPVITQGGEEAYLDSRYETPYFFSAEVFDKSPVRYLELERVYRQHDQSFVRLLNAIRNGSCDDSELSELNQRVGQPCPEGMRHVRLTATNDQAFRINHTKLQQLAGRQHTYEASISGRFPPTYYPTDSSLSLKAGAQIMMVRNDTEEHRWVNGEIGEVVSVGPNTIRVLLDDAEYDVEPVMWERFEYKWDAAEGTLDKAVAGTFHQYPLRLAWAVTIHKCQGQTLDAAVIDLGRGAFAHGQAYVALSRCRSLEGVSLARELRQSDIIFDSRCLGYRSRFEQAG